MKVGLIGSGNMARGLARGWGEPVLCTDPRADVAQALAAETGGQALATNGEVAEQADVVVLCHKPAQLATVAAEVAPHATAIVSILGATALADLRAAYPGAKVARYLPNTPVALGQGVLVRATASDEIDGVAELMDRLGLVVDLDEGLIDVAMGLMSNAPAYVALLIEAQVDAGVRHGLPPHVASQLATETFAGTAALLRERDFDTLAVRREVTSPGGSTARGLAALERAGVRAAFLDALDAVLEGR